MPLERIWDRSPHFEHGDEDVIDFYDKVRDNHFELYKQFDIDHIEVENTGTLDDAYEEVKEYAEKVLK